MATSSGAGMCWGQRGLYRPRQRRRPPAKRSNDDLCVRDELDTAPTGGRLHASMTRWGIHGMDDFNVEELTPLHQKLEGWMRQRAHDPERTRRRPCVMSPHMAYPA
jgi:hypothetical protein